MKISELKQIIKEELQTITEASNIDYKDIDQKTHVAIKKAKLENKVATSFDGIHGQIVNFDDGTGNIRVDKKQMSELLKNPNLRWIDIISIGV